jgi:hypothetical protein
MLTLLGEYLVEVRQVMCRSKWIAIILTSAMFSWGPAFHIARTRRLPIFSFTAFGSQPLGENKSIALAPLYKRGWQISDHRFLLGTFR